MKGFIGKRQKKFRAGLRDGKSRTERTTKAGVVNDFYIMSEHDGYFTSLIPLWPRNIAFFVSTLLNSFKAQN